MHGNIYSGRIMTFVLQASFYSTLYLFTESDFPLRHITDRTYPEGNGNDESPNPQNNKTNKSPSSSIEISPNTLSVSEPISSNSK